YIEETGIAQIYRDARIFPIYEGTNGIQAIDLVTRRLPLDDGAAIERFMARLRGEAAAVRTSNDPDLGGTAAALEMSLGDLETASAYLRQRLAADRPADALAGATRYLRLFALTAGACLYAGAVARGGLADGEDAWRVTLCRFM